MTIPLSAYSAGQNSGSSFQGSSSQIEADSFEALSRQFNLQFANLEPSVENLLTYICVATNDAVTTRGIGRYERVSPSQEQLSNLVDDLNQLATLPTGDQMLNHLCTLLNNKGENLCFSFVLDEGTTPLCKPSRVSINGNQKDCHAFIRLPKVHAESCDLPFYNVTSGKILKGPEPHFITIGHELLHGIQNLRYLESISSSIYQELNTHFSHRWLSGVNNSLEELTLALGPMNCKQWYLVLKWMDKDSAKQILCENGCLDNMATSHENLHNTRVIP
ncbi:MAG: hypothetical protein LBB19_01120 [Puniceicoccales bacterium]|jgi:hypothetical protein|nr:hypothetical protein [Puniceicoccales bacterium]